MFSTKIGYKKLINKNENERKKWNIGNISVGETWGVLNNYRQKCLWPIKA